MCIRDRDNNPPVDVTSCGSFYWPISQSTYDTSGIYTFNTFNTNGCDSTITLNLNIIYESTGASSVTACDSFTWEGQTATYSQNLSHTYVGGNSVGCDSIHTLLVTINNSSVESSSQTVCDSYVWDGTTYTTSGVYTNSYTNVNGCDSVSYTHLTLPTNREV